jgi:ABC-type Mn2+/Zn2+ transport system ATPase subunit
MMPRTIPATVPGQQSAWVPTDDDALVVAHAAQVWRGEGAQQRCVVADLNWVVRPRSIHALVGDNGAGKSSILLALLGLLPSTIVVRTTALAYAPQRLVCAPHLPLTVADWCGLAHGKRSLPVSVVLEAADLAGRGLEGRALCALSGGELSRMATALAVLSRPALCLLDEPTASVDEQSRSVVETLIRRARDDGAGVVLVTHDERHVAALADVVTHIGAARHVP